MTHVPVILHERLGAWASQLQSRLGDRPVRWYETRSLADLDAATLGVACPVVLIDLSRNVEALAPWTIYRGLCRGRGTLVLDPDIHEGVAMLARELGATEVISGFVPPPEVADRIDRWISLAAAQIEREGWSRPLAADSPVDSESWIEAVLAAEAEPPGHTKSA